MIVPFSYETFKASIDSGKPLKLVTSDQTPQPIYYPDIKMIDGILMICAVHGAMGEQSQTTWQMNGVYRLDGSPGPMDLQMVLDDEIESPEYWRGVADYCNWLYNEFENQQDAPAPTCANDLIKLFRDRGGK